MCDIVTLIYVTPGGGRGRRGGGESMPQKYTEDREYRCVRCLAWKPKKQFNPDIGMFGITTHCNECAGKRAIEKAQRIENKRIYALAVAERKAARAIFKLEYEEKSRDWNARKHEYLMLAWARRRAKLYGVPFKITVDDIIIPETCPVFGFKMIRNNGVGARSTPQSPTIDRTVDKKGYVPGNIQVISCKANSMKGSRDINELRQFAKWILTLK